MKLTIKPLALIEEAQKPNEGVLQDQWLGGTERGTHDVRAPLGQPGIPGMGFSNPAANGVGISTLDGEDALLIKADEVRIQAESNTLGAILSVKPLGLADVAGDFRAAVSVHALDDPEQIVRLDVRTDGTTHVIDSHASGGGSAIPITINFNGSEKQKVNTNGVGFGGDPESGFPAKVTGDLSVTDEIQMGDAATGASVVGRLRRNGNVLTWHDSTAAREIINSLRLDSGGTIFSRRRLNLIQGNGVGIAVADDAGNNEIDITFRATEPLFQARMVASSGTSLALENFNGNFVLVGTERVLVANVDDWDTGDNLIAADGTDAGGDAAVDTLYYVYVSNSSASFSATSLRGSATAPSEVDGVLYLGTTGNALNWRFVGRIRTIDAGGGTVNFADSESRRFVQNHYNKIRKHLLTRPGYSDNNAQTTFNFTGASWAALNGGTSDFVEFIADGINSVELAFNAQATSQTGAIAIGIDTSTNPQGAAAAFTSAAITQCAIYKDTPAAGYHVANMCAVVPAGTAVIVADRGRSGANADVCMTYLKGSILV